MKKDKQKVLGETFDRERLQAMLAELTLDPTRSDFEILERAYRGMKADNFATFIELFQADGHDIHAKNDAGASLADVISKHRHGQDYLAALNAA